jgi:hypothetical protein
MASWGSSRHQPVRRVGTLLLVLNRGLTAIAAEAIDRSTQHPAAPAVSAINLAGWQAGTPELWAAHGLRVW